MVKSPSVRERDLAPLLCDRCYTPSLRSAGAMPLYVFRL